MFFPVKPSWIPILLTELHGACLAGASKMSKDGSFHHAIHHIFETPGNL
jgi:hypothetical protein